jgi:DNA-binding NarL/FixJ family response regulator
LNSARLHVLALHDGASATPAISALLAPHEGIEAIARSTEVVRAIGNGVDNDARRRDALALASAFDVIVIGLTDEIVRLGDVSLTLGIVTLADLGVPIVLLLGFGDEGAAEFSRAAEWVRRRVRAVISGDATIAEVLTAVHAASAGLVVLEPRAAGAMADAAARRRAGQTPAPSRAAASTLPLSAREREVLALLAEGHATKHIAHLLGISSHTVKAHVESIFGKFGATTRAEAVAIGVRRGAVLL